METTISEGRNAAGRVLAPHSLEEFFAEYYERQPLHIERNDERYFSDVYSVAEIENSLVTGAREIDRFAMVSASAGELPHNEFTILRPALRGAATGRAPTANIDPGKVLAYFGKGYTLIVKDAGLFSATLQRFCTALHRDLHAYAQANVYFTPPSAQGFAVHHDTHDTLTIQIDGVKTWKIYDPVIQLPTETQPFPSGADVPVRLNREVTLYPGDTLYVPRGFPHEAMTSSSGRSVHVTFALAPVRIMDVLTTLVGIACDADVELRRSFPRGWEHDPQFVKMFAQRALDTFVRACTPERIHAAREIALASEFFLERANLREGFDRIEHLETIADNAIVRVREDVPYDVRIGETVISVLLPSRSIVFPAFCRRALEQLAQGPVRFGAFDPELALENRYVLVRLLANEGVLEISPP